MSGDSNGWGEYSKMVLKELEVLGQGITALKADMEGLKREMTELALAFLTLLKERNLS